jgi:hypothetical protein
MVWAMLLAEIKANILACKLKENPSWKVLRISLKDK